MRKTTLRQQPPALASTIRTRRCCPTGRSLAGKKFNRADGHQIPARRAPVNFLQRDIVGAWLLMPGQSELFAAANHRTDDLCRIPPQLSQCCFHACKLYRITASATDFPQLISGPASLIHAVFARSRRQWDRSLNLSESAGSRSLNCVFGPNDAVSTKSRKHPADTTATSDRPNTRGGYRNGRRKYLWRFHPDVTPKRQAPPKAHKQAATLRGSLYRGSLLPITKWR